MSQHLFTNPGKWSTSLVIAATLAFSLLLLAVSPGRQSVSAPAGTALGLVSRTKNGERIKAPKQLAGEDARKYLRQPGEGQSLMQAITAARFGLKRQDQGPFGEVGAGYLGISHIQNLNAWFADEGLTVRPTVAEQERERSWHMDMRLKAYGYGNNLITAPPIVSRHVKGNRIEYERAENCELRIANCEFKKNALFNPQSAIRNPKFVEWYENRAEGIEQGFTIAERPERKTVTSADEPLRLVLSLKGELRAHAKDEGRAIELIDAAGKRALSYSNLTVLDAVRKQLAAHMETSADGMEIALVVDERGAAYPITIDPIAASLEKILDAGPTRQSGAQFGDAVAIDGDKAIVGAWLEDLPFTNAGAAYVFSRTGSSWNLVASLSAFDTNYECGYSVAISGTRATFGCAGANSNAGKAFIVDLSSGVPAELIPLDRRAGDMYGASVAISGNRILVGAPGFDFTAWPNAGLAHLFTLDSAGNPGSPFTFAAPDSGETQLGASVAIEGDTIIAGAPGSGAGGVFIWRRDPAFPDVIVFFTTVLHPNDGAAGDLFGTGVAISNNTAVIGAAGNDQKGTDAGAAYVFVRNAGEQWSQQQKLTAGDGKTNDIFSYNAVAIEGNTIVVGARRQDGVSSNPNDNRGAVYIFTRSGTVWTQQARLEASFGVGAPGDEYGTSVDISGNTVIVSAPHGAATDGTANAGKTYVYSLDCVPPSNRSAASFNPIVPFPTASVCPGNPLILFLVDADGTAPRTYQWRKNGVNIPGAIGLTYNINPVSASDAASYDVVNSNACGSEISVPFILTVHTFNLSPNQNFSAAGSPGIVGVTSTGSCPWTAVSNSSFITINSGASGSGNGTVNFTVAGNTGPNQRTGTITIADKTFTVTQDGLNCIYSIAPTSQGLTAAGAANNSVSVTATAGCAWSAVSNNTEFITISSGNSGTGNGTANYSVAANTGPARTGTLTVAGQSVTVTQASGCAYSISPMTQNFPSSVAAGAVNVTTVAGCAWTAQTNAPSVISITSGNSGTGNGIVNYSVTANTGPTRAGTLTIAGQTFTVTQDGAAPLVSSLQFNAPTYSIGEAVGFATITVTRTADTTGTVAVNFETSDVGARQRTDYTLAAGTLTFAPGETSKTFRVLIADDLYVEGDETLNLTLSSPSGGAVLGNPSTAVLTIADNDSTSAATNPLDGARFFVQEHYYDFLARYPDTGGWDFWAGTITSCGSDPNCIRSRRIDASNAFFYELEFQQTGSYVYRLYRAAFGNNQPFPNPNPDPAHLGEEKKVPLYLAFMKDRARVRGGSQLAQLQLDLANAFVLRDEFKSKYPVGLNGPGFVDAVLAAISNDLGVNLGSQRQGLIDLFNQGGRGNVLYRLADDSTLTNPINNRALIDAEYNRAFVFTQYAGYLRRNPDMAGFLFWLSQVNAASLRDVTRQHAMVCAFITSAEYQQRFSSIVTHSNADCQ